MATGPSLCAVAVGLRVGARAVAQGDWYIQRGGAQRLRYLDHVEAAIHAVLATLNHRRDLQIRSRGGCLAVHHRGDFKVAKLLDGAVTWQVSRDRDIRIRINVEAVHTILRS